ncbi:MAG: hypothetical protein KA978_14510 [Deltaproteobacteria bacterium]|nr:hypothetical protein [Deltaproteobacteria bacterium]MBP6831995.1 hypothetical protein [Deltaproteobacteria bacterium]
MKKTPRKPGTSRMAQRDALRLRLQEALSDDELEEVLPAALLALDAAGRQRLLDGLEAPTRDALTLALTPPSKGAESGRAGRRKVEQEWEKLWARWDEIVTASGDEEGEYVHQDHAWDTPYADRGSVTDDLDEVAKQLRALMPAVIAADLAPDLRFTEILEDLDDELGAGLPDWIGSPDGDDYHLGPEATRLFLEWDWAMEEASGVSPKAFLDAWLEVEGRMAQVRLDTASVEGFRPARRSSRRPRA